MLLDMLAHDPLTYRKASLTNIHSAQDSASQASKRLRLFRLTCSPKLHPIVTIALVCFDMPLKWGREHACGAPLFAPLTANTWRHAAAYDDSESGADRQMALPFARRGRAATRCGLGDPGEQSVLYRPAFGSVSGQTWGTESSSAHDATRLSSSRLSSGCSPFRSTKNIGARRLLTEGILKCLSIDGNLDT